MLRQVQLVGGFLAAVQPLPGLQEVSVALVIPPTITIPQVEDFSARLRSLPLEAAILGAVVCLEVQAQEGPLAQQTTKVPVLSINQIVPLLVQMLVNVRGLEVRHSLLSRRKRLLGVLPTTFKASVSWLHTKTSRSR